MVRLLSSSGSFIDSMTYTAIPTNKSFSRIPNGTGSFVIAAPTPNYSNSATGNISVGELVINEFAADNDSIADPAGETDDWIEFYNNTTHTIDLSGLYLSDSYSNVIKWKFPDGTILRAGYYLIVWADQDTAQIGLHATFALSASGERIILSNKDLTVIDSVSFGAQIKNKTMARKPNGTGNFVLSSPTFGYSNTPLSSNETEYQPAGYRLDQNYPNPFNPTTTITYSLAQARKVNLTIYNMLGEAVITLTNEFQSAGIYKVQWNGMNSLMAQIPSGIYFYKLTTNSFSQIRKMILLK
jgi:hypothetical protein